MTKGSISTDLCDEVGPPDGVPLGAGLDGERLGTLEGRSRQ